MQGGAGGGLPEVLRRTGGQAEGEGGGADDRGRDAVAAEEFEQLDDAAEAGGDEQHKRRAAPPLPPMQLGRAALASGKPGGGDSEGEDTKHIGRTVCV